MGSVTKTRKCDLAVIFITLNEEFHIGSAIDNVSDIAKEVWVVDSGSSDRTVAIAESKGARVVYHKFEGFGAQWNFALSLPIRTDWTMKMDPDERLTEALKIEIMEALSEGGRALGGNHECHLGFSFDRVLWFMGKRLDGVRNEVQRIWRTGDCHFSDVSVNEYPLIRGKWVKLKAGMDHLDSRDLSHWLTKQNGYTSREAQMRFLGSRMAADPKLFGSALERRMWLKKTIRNLPGRYLVENFYNFFMLGAWKSGMAGWRWVKCREMVSRLCEYKYIEMRDSDGSDAV